jgi:hypothetical protein
VNSAGNRGGRTDNHARGGDENEAKEDNDDAD